MAVTFTTIEAGATEGAASSYNTGSFTWTNGARYLLQVSSRALTSNAAEPSSISGQTCTKITGLQTPDTNRRETLYEFTGDGTTTVLTINIAGSTEGRVGWTITKLSGEDSSGTFVQFASNASNSASSLTATLAAFGSANNATYLAGSAFNANQAFTAGSGFTVIGSFSPAASPTLSVADESRADNDTTADLSWSIAAACTVIAVEIKAAAAGGGGATNHFLSLLGVGT